MKEKKPKLKTTERALCICVCVWHIEEWNWNNILFEWQIFYSENWKQKYTGGYRFFFLVLCSECGNADFRLLGVFMSANLRTKCCCHVNESLSRLLDHSPEPKDALHANIFRCFCWWCICCWLYTAILCVCDGKYGFIAFSCYNACARKCQE